MGRLSKLIEKRYLEAISGNRPPRLERKAIRRRIVDEVYEQAGVSRVATRPLYDNCLVLHPRGELMFRCKRYRFDWYLANTESELVTEDPPTLRLRFEPAGPGHLGDEFHLQPRRNVCVCCGVTKNLTRHHVLPKSLRIHYPLSYLRKNQHDIVPICFTCHRTYETRASALMTQIASELGVSLNDKHSEEPAAMAARNARVIWRHGDRMPSARRFEILEEIRAYLERDVTDEDIETLRSQRRRRGGWSRRKYQTMVERSDLEVLGAARRSPADASVSPATGGVAMMPRGRPPDLPRPVKRQLEAIDVERYDIGLREETTGKFLHRYDQGVDEVIAMLPWLKHMNARSNHVYVRPAGVEHARSSTTSRRRRSRA